MANFSNRDVQIYAGWESTSGTAVNPTVVFPHSGASFKRAESKIQTQVAFGKMNQNVNQTSSMSYGTGTIPGDLSVRIMGCLLTLLNKSAPTTSGSSSPYTHTWSFSEVTNGKTMTFYRKNDNYTERFAGCALSTLEFDIMTDSYAKYTADIMGIDVSSSTQNQPTYDSTTEQFIVPSSTELKVAANASGISGATPIPVKSLKFKYDAQLEGYPVINSKSYSVMVSKGFSVSIEATLLFNDTTYRDFWTADTGRYCRFEINTGTANRMMTFDLTNAKIFEWDDTDDINTYGEQTFTFVGYIDSSGNTLTSKQIDTYAGSTYGG